MAEVTILKSVSSKIAQELAELGSILHEDTRSMTEEELREVVDNSNIVLAVVEDGGSIKGMASLYVIPKVGKKSGLIEDVIVDESLRGQGLGEKLVRTLIEEARKRGLGSISLTSRPSRVAAHKLYEKLGFAIKETDVFRLSL